MSFRGATRSTKRDRNEGVIIDALEACGCVVLPLSGLGVPDLLVLRQIGDTWRLIGLAEVKAKGGKLTPAQTAWRARWQGPEPVRLETPEQAIRFATANPGAS